MSRKFSDQFSTHWGTLIKFYSCAGLLSRFSHDFVESKCVTGDTFYKSLFQILVCLRFIIVLQYYSTLHVITTDETASIITKNEIRK
jgi:hypothetical protein